MLAVACANTGSPAALSAHADAVKAFRELQDQSFWLPAALADYGNALAQAGRIDEARRTLDQAVTLARAEKNDILLPQAMDFQGQNAFYAGDLSSARRLLQTALQIAGKPPINISSYLSE